MPNRYTSKTALLGSIVDYAGTFPPAKLPLDKALKLAAGFRTKAKHPWLLSRIALPVKDISALSGAKLMELGADGSPWVFTALGAAKKFEELPQEIESLRLFNQKSDGQSCRLYVHSYETTVLNEVVTNGDESEITEAARQVLEHFHCDGMQPYFEVSLTSNWISGLEALCKLLKSVATKKNIRPGIKIRTGGKVVPTSEQLSRCLTLCARFGLRFKATQGLHHPVSREGEFGFVNLFASLNFAHVLGTESFGKAVVQRCLEEQKTENFKFGTNKFSWREFEISNAEIESARERHMGCFGSCSLNEPDNYLAKNFS